MGLFSRKPKPPNPLNCPVCGNNGNYLPGTRNLTRNISETHFTSDDCVSYSNVQGAMIRGELVEYGSYMNHVQTKDKHVHYFCQSCKNDWTTVIEEVNV